MTLAGFSPLLVPSENQALAEKHKYWLTPGLGDISRIRPLSWEPGSFAVYMLFCMKHGKQTPCGLSSPTSCSTLPAVTLTLYPCSPSFSDMDQVAINLFTLCRTQPHRHLAGQYFNKKHLTRFIGLLLPTVDCGK